ncbi:hypothetical protein CEP54_013484 [Fusarium duplospermum]|uniref:Uncharacterized protein n=1 Tax=Fusarium duplospermum TaxID=1325734 RepID=A0A428P2K8_9HYPO|nr:hypothetical protein CEP54_013484 [Fusarium duplospermum]
MALQLAPYNNAMRLGQGFNSYTQQICLTDAVMRPSDAPNGKKTIKVGDDALTKPTDGTETPKPKQGVSQIVSYSSRFVEKLSDITDAMNISASLSIKTATIGGGASGQFIDSDKFKESDINFFVQVKVVNQAIIGEDYTEFQPVLPVGVNFNEVYGDTFISGFEEGGELNALISVKVSDKNKTFAVKAELEATLGTPALSGKVKGGVEIDKSEIKNSTETTVTVNWSGGGQIKPSNAIWDVNTLTLAACNFPDLVAQTPQKTYAILRKYTTLKSFLAVYKPASVLTYENAGVYTGALLDMYMDYKSIWKQIQIANFELRNRRADIAAATPSEEVVELAKLYKEEKAKKKEPEEPFPIDPNLGITAAAEPSPSRTEEVAPKESDTTTEKPTAEDGTEKEEPPVKDPAKDENTTKMPVVPVDAPQAKTNDPIKTEVNIPNLIDYTAYSPTVLGLDKARRHCRNEMIKIVSEVDIITTFPNLALDYRREEKFVSPRIFTQLLPVVTLRAVETDKAESTLNPKNLVILGETDEAPKLQQWLYNRLSSPDSRPPFPALTSSLGRHKTKSKEFDMGDTWSGVDDPGKGGIFFNCLDSIDKRSIPREIAVWVKDDLLRGLKVYYTNGAELTHGKCDGDASKKFYILTDKSHSVIQLVVEAAEPRNSKARVMGLQLTLNNCYSEEYPELGRSVATLQNPTTVTLSQPTNGFWSFRGFWGSATPYGGGFLALGAVWGLDDPKAHEQPTTQPLLPTGPNGTDYQMFMGRPLPGDAIATADAYRSKAGKYSMSGFIGTTEVDKTRVKYFNDLGPLRDFHKVESIKFHKDSKGQLAGYTTRYVDGPPIRNGFEEPTSQGSSQEKIWTDVTLNLIQRENGDKVVNFVGLNNILREEHENWEGENGATVERTTLCRPDAEDLLANMDTEKRKNAVGEMVKAMQHPKHKREDISFTMGWDVVITYSESQINSLLEKRYNENKTKILHTLEMTVDLPQSYKKTPDRTQYVLKLGPPLLEFESTDGAQPLCSIKMRVIEGTITKHGGNPRKSKPGWMIRLGQIPLASAKGTVSQGKLQGNPTLTPAPDAIKFDPKKDETQHVLLAFELNASLTVEAFPEDPESHNAEDAAFTNLEFRKAFREYFTKPANSQDRLSLSYAIASVNNQPDDRAPELRPVKFQFATFSTQDKNKSLFSIFLDVAGGPNSGQSDMLQDRWAKQWKDEGIVPVPEGFSATVMFSSAFFNTVILKNGLSKSGWAVEDVSPKDQPYSKIECRNTGTFEILERNITWKEWCKFHMDGAQIPLSKYPLGLTIRQDSEFETPNIHGFWKITHDLSWQNLLMGSIEVRSGQGNIAGRWHICDKNDFSKAQNLDTNMSLTDEALNVDLTLKTQGFIQPDYDLTSSVDNKTCELALTELSAQAPKVKASFGIGFLRTTNLLFPGGNAIDIDRNIGIRAPKDIILFGDVMKY